MNTGRARVQCEALTRQACVCTFLAPRSSNTRHRPMICCKTHNTVCHIYGQPGRRLAKYLIVSKSGLPMLSRSWNILLKSVSMGFIYSIRCTVTGKLYVGQTRNAVHKRWRQHQCPSSLKDTHLGRAIKKYGWDMFEFKVVTECDNADLDELEIHYISKWNTFEDGLNSTPGGQKSSPMLVPELKQKRIDVMKIPDVRENWLKAITAAQQRPEQRALLSKLCTERCKDPEHMKKRAAGVKKFLDTLDDSGREWVVQRMLTKEAIAKRVAKFKKTASSEIAKQKKSNATKLAWQNPHSRAKRMESLKEAAAKRKKVKLPKVPYDRERRSQAARASWERRQGWSSKLTIAAFEQGRDGQKTAALHTAKSQKQIVSCDVRDCSKFKEELLTSKAARSLPRLILGRNTQLPVGMYDPSSPSATNISEICWC